MKTRCDCDKCNWSGVMTLISDATSIWQCPGCLFIHGVKNHPAASTGAQREKLNAIPYDLVPFQEMTDAYVRVAEFGARKYEAWNWSKGLSRIQIIASLLRHTWAYLRGEERDSDSGLLHTDHILWNAVTLVHNVHWNLEDGRRPEPPREYKTRGENVLPRNPVQHSVE